MHLGQFAKIVPADQLYRRPLHPYTAVLASMPGLDPATGRARRPTPLADEPRRRRSTRRVSAGSAPRCPRAQGRCSVEEQALRERPPGHHVACHFPLDEVVARSNDRGASNS
jgi:oligopeptide transport system ATP-binding protein